MEPKFQSSFIPRGGAVSSTPVSAAIPVTRKRQKDALSFIANTIFTLSVLFALGVFGYKFFLNQRIAQMGTELESARAAIEPETVDELITLDARLVATHELIEKHQIISPLFDFLEAVTPRSVRYNHFSFDTTTRGLQLVLRGEAISYSALAALAEVFNRSNTQFINPVFSDLELDVEGNVRFTLTTQINPQLLSYNQIIPSSTVLPPTSTATSSQSSTFTPGTNPPRN